MNYRKYLFAILGVIALSDAVKVNMQGSLNLGKDVVEALSYHFKKNYISGRRSMTSSKGNDPVYMIIKSSYLCRDLHFCERRRLEKFINEYITVLAKLIQGIFEDIMNEEPMPIDENEQKPLIFEKELRTCLTEIKKFLREINYKITDDNEWHQWTGLIKRTNALFQDTAIKFAIDKLEGKPEDVAQAKKKLTQEIIVTTSVAEERYETKLCTDHKICGKHFECSTSLNEVLQTFKDMEEEKVKIFVKYIYTALPDTFFFSILSELTVNEFQVVLNDMAYSKDVPAKKILLTIQKTVQDRLNHLSSKKTHAIIGKDVELVHIILSDMDFLYSTNKAGSFHGFLSQYFEWIRNGGKLGHLIRRLFTEINKQLQNSPPHIVKKLTKEVRVFLELTVDPESGIISV